MNRSIALVFALSFALCAPAFAGPVPPSTHFGLAAGGHQVVSDWEVGARDEDGNQVSPDGDGLLRVRLGQQFTTAVGFEVSLGYMPLSIGDELATGLIYDADLLLTLKEGPVMPVLILGGGAYHVFGTDDGTDLDAQFHYGFELRGSLNQRVAIRGGLRHTFADSLEPEQDFSNHIELTFGFDLLFGVD